MAEKEFDIIALGELNVDLILNQIDGFPEVGKEKFARQILEHFELDKYFEHVVGATLDGKLGRKSDIIKKALKDLEIKDHQQVIMIGDREYDISGANDSGLDSIGVLYGFGRCEELRQAGATQIAESTEEVVKYVLGQDAN